MLEAFAPLSLVPFAIWPIKDTLPMFVIVVVLTDVLPPIRPRENTYTVHLVVCPRALIHASVRPNVGALPADLVVVELSDIAACIGPLKLALAVLFAIQKLTFEHSSVWPLLPSEPVLVIGIKFANISAAICVHIYSLATSLPIPPNALIAITIGVDEPTWPTGLTFLPEAFIPGPVGPELDSTPHSN